VTLIVSLFCLPFVGGVGDDGRLLTGTASQFTGLGTRNGRVSNWGQH
jgi:hypothetical protein